MVWGVIAPREHLQQVWRIRLSRAGAEPARGHARHCKADNDGDDVGGDADDEADADGYGVRAAEQTISIKR